jgi:hypothetical protein
VATATEVPAIAGFNEIASEIDWLSRVARAFTTSPVVLALDTRHPQRVAEGAP